MLSCLPVEYCYSNIDYFNAVDKSLTFVHILSKLQHQRWLLLLLIPPKNIIFTSDLHFVIGSQDILTYYMCVLELAFFPRMQQGWQYFSFKPPLNMDNIFAHVWHIYTCLLRTTSLTFCIQYSCSLLRSLHIFCRLHTQLYVCAKPFST